MGDDCHLIVHVQDLVGRVVCNYMVWMMCGARSFGGCIKSWPGRVDVCSGSEMFGCSPGCAPIEAERNR